MSLAKSVDKATAKSGELLTYTITYLNTGNAPISALVINDATPAFTTLSSASFAAPLSNNLTGCTITAPSAGQSDSIAWKFTGTLAPGTNGTVSFVVKLKLRRVAAGLQTDENGNPVLDFNGGPTPTVALLSESPALNASDPATKRGTDQRAAGFLCVVNERADIGAFELQTFISPSASPSSRASSSPSAPSG